MSDVKKLKKKKQANIHAANCNANSWYTQPRHVPQQIWNTGIIKTISATQAEPLKWLPRAEIMILFEVPLADKSTGTLSDFHFTLELQPSAVTLMRLQLPEKTYCWFLFILTKVCSSSLKTEIRIGWTCWMNKREVVQGVWKVLMTWIIPGHNYYG